MTDRGIAMTEFISEHFSFDFSLFKKHKINFSFFSGIFRRSATLLKSSFRSQTGIDANDALISLFAYKYTLFPPHGFKYSIKLHACSVNEPKNGIHICARRKKQQQPSFQSNEKNARKQIKCK